MGRARAGERLYLRGRVWWCYGYKPDGGVWQESTHQRDKETARLAARTIERRYAADPDHRARAKLTARYAFEQVLAFQVEAGRASNTQRATEYHIAHLRGRFDDVPLSEITLADTTQYLRDRLAQGASRHTVKKELGTLTQAIRRVTKLGVYVPKTSPEHLFPDELGKAYEPRRRWLTRDQYAALLQALAPSVPGRLQIVPEDKRRRAPREDRRDYVIAWCNLGVRKSELFDIQPEDYDPVRRELRVRGTKTEGADRLVPVNDAAAEVLTRRVGCVRPFPAWENVTTKLEAVCGKLMIPNVTPNDFRRTFCSWLCQAGVPERVCAELLGHGSTVMVRAVYGQLDRDALRRAVVQI